MSRRRYVTILALVAVLTLVVGVAALALVEMLSDVEGVR